MSANCQLEPVQKSPTAPPPAGLSINVGDKMLLTCADSFSDAPRADSLNVVADAPEKEYQLKVLKVLETSSQQVKMVVTSYSVGQYQGQVFKLSDGKISFETSPIAFTVESVVDPKNPPEKPYPSEGPFRLSFPLWFWLAWAAVLIFVVAVVVLIFYRRRRRARLMAELERYATMLSPYAQYSKDMRSLSRQLASPSNKPNEMFNKLDEDFRLYLIRELKVPALQVSNRELLGEIRRSHRPVYDGFQSELRRILFELDKGKRDIEKVKVKDCEDLLFLSRRLADSIQSVVRERQKREFK